MPEKMIIGRAEGIDPAARGGAAPPVGITARDRGQQAEQPVQELRELGRGEPAHAGAGRVQDPDDPAQQVAEQVAGARDRGDVQVDRVRVHPQPEQVQRDRVDHQVEDLARRGLGRRRRTRVGSDRQLHVALGEVRPADRALQRADGLRLVALGDEAADRVRGLQLLAVLGRAGDLDDLVEGLGRRRLRRRDAGASDEHERAGERGRYGGQAIPGQWDLLREGLGLGPGCPGPSGPENGCAGFPTLASFAVDARL
jgi:hypothetical protein